MREVRVEIDSQKLEKVLAEALRDTIQDIAEAVVKEAQDTAPVDTGMYRDGIKARQVGELEWEAVATVEYSEAVEYRWSYLTMTQAAKAAKP